MSSRIVKTEECNCEPLKKTLILPTTNIPLIGNFDSKKLVNKELYSEIKVKKDVKSI